MKGGKFWYLEKEIIVAITFSKLEYNKPRISQMRVPVVASADGPKFLEVRLVSSKTSRIVQVLGLGYDGLFFVPVEAGTLGLYRRIFYILNEHDFHK